MGGYSVKIGETKSFNIFFRVHNDSSWRTSVDLELERKSDGKCMDADTWFSDNEEKTGVLSQFAQEIEEEVEYYFIKDKHLREIVEVNSSLVKVEASLEKVKKLKEDLEERLRRIMEIANG